MEDILKKIFENNSQAYKYGKVADYIPALKEANIKDCGITIIDKDKNIYSYGVYNKRFTIQSISKVLSLMLAIMDNGIEKVFTKVGYGGTERLFNTMAYIQESGKNKAINPMINGGAITVTSMIKGSREEKFNRILEITRILAKNREIECNNEVYTSEKNTGDRNRAIAYMLKSEGILEGNAESIVDVYFKQCSIDVDTVDLANIAMAISDKFKDINLGNDIDKIALSSLLINIMNNAGMYNSSGQWSVEVGIPSKSGVAGGIMSVVPERYGIGFYGPSLDGNGNSIVGSRIIKELSNNLNLKTF